MKTPDEIKKGLAEAPHIQYRTSTQNDSDGHSTRYAVAIDYVFRDEIVGCLQQLEASYRQISKALCGKENATLDEVLQAIAQVKAELKAVKRERDAACITIKQMAEALDSPACEWCKGNLFDAFDATCKECRMHNEGFEWRGVCPENTEVQDDD